MDPLRSFRECRTIVTSSHPSATESPPRAGAHRFDEGVRQGSVAGDR